MEAWAGIEPAIQVLQTRALPLGYHAIFGDYLLAECNNITPYCRDASIKYGIKNHPDNAWRGAENYFLREAVLCKDASSV